MKTTITTSVSFIYRGWIGYVTQHWFAMNKFKVSLTAPFSCLPTEHVFTVTPHWYTNYDWEKAVQLAKRYIDENYGDAPIDPTVLSQKLRTFH